MNQAYLSEALTANCGVAGRRSSKTDSVTSRGSARHQSHVNNRINRAERWEGIAAASWRKTSRATSIMHWICAGTQGPPRNTNPLSVAPAINILPLLALKARGPPPATWAIAILRGDAWTYNRTLQSCDRTYPRQTRSCALCLRSTWHVGPDKVATTSGGLGGSERRAQICAQLNAHCQ